MITDDQIYKLEQESGEAGDLAQVAICERAFGLLDTESTIEDAEGVLIALAMTVDEARDECARVIADAAAQEES